MVYPQIEYNAPVKKNKEDLYELIGNYFQDILLSKKHKVWKNISSMLSFVWEIRKFKKIYQYQYLYSILQKITRKIKLVRFITYRKQSGNGV